MNLAQQHPVSHSHQLLDQMSRFWGDRAKVKQEEFDSSLVYDVEEDDFLDDLIPLKAHPRFQEYYEEFRTQLLACGWLAYNEKTIDIESQIISPTCVDLIYGDIPGSNCESIRWSASETLVDEGYHVLMVVNAMRACKKSRNLEHVKLRNFALTMKMNEEIAKYTDPSRQMIIRLVTSIVSEVFISDYLSLLSDAEEIQPLNRMTTATHKRDEMAHSGIFRTFAKEIYQSMGNSSRQFFAENLPKPVRWFASRELNVWQTILDYLAFPHAREIIEDCRSEGESDLTRIDYSELIQLSGEAGILDTEVGRDAFSREGII